jgi:hypothetical protein
VQEVRTTLALAQQHPAGAPPGFFLPTLWLEAWSNSDAPPGPVPTLPLACAHGRLDPLAWPAVRYVSADAWRAIVVSMIAH